MKVDVVIEQAPVDVVFTCPHCKEEITVDYQEFEEMTSADLGSLLYDKNYFTCPECEETLEIDECTLD